MDDAPFTVHADTAKPRHSVGFRSFWTTDPARSYRTAWDDGATYGAGKTKRPRPVLVNVWYPAADTDAAAVPMTHGEYLDITPDDPDLVPLAAALLDYQHTTIGNELTRTGSETRSEEQRRGVESAMKRLTGCVRDASELPARFPLVLYHSGAGSSFEDDARLCEELAAHGYVVIGSPFYEADGSSFNVDYENAGREFEFLIRVAAAMENVDGRHVGVVGHSLGAQATLRYAAQPAVAPDAIVSLDTTQDYATLAFPLWPHLVSSVRAGQHYYTTPTLFVAGPRAIFDLADSLVQSDRVYLTVPGLGHNDFISQGEDAAAFVSSDASAAAEIAERGSELRRLVRSYLDSRLKGDTDAFAALEALQQTRLGSGPRVELTPAGQSGPGTDSGETTPRTVFQALKSGGVEAAIDQLAAADEADKAMVSDRNFAMHLVYYLGHADRMEDAKRLFEFYLTQGVDIRQPLVADAEFFDSKNLYPDLVITSARLAAAVGGAETFVEEMVKKYGEKLSLK